MADDVLERFADVGLIDDAAFARAWVESRHHSRGLAGRALTLELKRRGVDDEEIREAVAELGPDAEAATAKRLVEQKLGSTAACRPRCGPGGWSRACSPARVTRRGWRSA